MPDTKKPAVTPVARKVTAPVQASPSASPAMTAKPTAPVAEAKPVVKATPTPVAAKPAPAPVAAKSAPDVKPAPAVAAKPTPAVAPKLAPAAAKPVATPAPVAAKPAPAAPPRAAPRSFTKPTPPVAAIVAPVLSTTAIEGSKTMATTAADAAAKTTDKVQTLISDAQTRANDAMAKSTKMYEEMGSFAKGNVEAVMASSRVAASGFESLGQDIAEFGKRSLDQATTAFKSFATVKSPTELFQLQSDYARSAFDGMVAEGSKMSEKMLKLAGDVAQPLSSRMSVAAEKVRVGL